MELLEVTRKGLVLYRANPVLFVPPFVAFIISILTSAILPRDIAHEGFPAITPSILMMGFGALFLMMAVSFLVILGQVNMSGKVITKGKTTLADWGDGVKKYFFRVLGIGLVFLGIMVVLFMVVGMAYALTILPEMITPEGVVSPSFTPAPQAAYMGWAMTLIMVVAQSVFYIWLAPAIMNNKSVGTSLDLGIKAIKKGGRVFVSFIILFFIVSVVTMFVENSSTFMGTTIQPLVGSLTYTKIVSQLIEKVFSPLWFLVAFAIYRKHSK
ncbi:hypothetical protein [[Eubacterium] cellulosolvens]